MSRWLGRITMVLALGVGGPGMAAAPDQCESFTVYSDGSAREVTYLDHSPDGKSVGDQRIGYRAIKDNFGAQVGEHRWTATVVEVAQSADQADKTSSEGVFIFPAGHLFVTRPAAPVFADPTRITEVGGNGDLFVIGGSGAFEGARGIAQRPKRGDLAQSYAFDIRCD